jgi:hypothetical protein
MAVSLACLVLSHRLNHDAAWWLTVADEMRRGGELYATIIEVNPPLIAYLSMAPLFLAQVTRLPIEVVFEACVLGVAGASLIATWWLTSDVAERGFVLALVGAELLAFLGTPGVDFGQREHLMLMLVTPYVILIWRRLSGYPVRWPAAVLAGVAGAVGFCLKPHFILVWLALEAWSRFGHRGKARRPGRRIEAWLVAGLGLVYLVFILVRYPAYITLLREGRELYASFARQPLFVLLGSAVVVPMGLAALTSTQRAGPSGLLARVWLIVAVSAFALMVVQRKGWTYHEYPALASTIIVAVLLGVDVVSSNDSWIGDQDRRLVSVFATCLATALVLPLSLWAQTPQQKWRRDVITAREPFLSQLAPGTSLVMFTDLMEDAFPLVELTGVRWASPFPAIWWVRSLYSGDAARPDLRPPAAMLGVERRFNEALIGRMEVVRPDYVLVDRGRSNVFGGEPFPFVRYFGQFPAFRDLWSQYELAGSLDRFEVWRRADSQPITPGALRTPVSGPPQ